MYSEAVLLASSLAAAGAAKAASSASACQAGSRGAKFMALPMQCCQCPSSCKVRSEAFLSSLHIILAGIAFGMAVLSTQSTILIYARLAKER